MKRSIDFRLLERRYFRLDRAGKSHLLDELCDLHQFNRKYLIQVFNHLTGKQHIRRGPKRRYDPKELLEPLKRIWLATDMMCSKKLKVALPLWLPFYDDFYEPLPPTTKAKLCAMSAATIDRLLKPHRAHYRRRGLTGTKPGYLLKNQIPIKVDHWDVTQPGFLEADTVAHCGDSMAGDFAWTLTMTDITTGWTENRATWNKGASGVLKQIKNIEKSLPFPILGFDCDNGSEFLNWHLLRYFQERRGQTVQVTRSRPYRKNDNAHVEQKNWTHVRQLFGYDRFDNQKAIKKMNDLYTQEWSLYQNHFIPTMKLIEKEKINAKYRRKYEQPKTPYERVITSEQVSAAQKERLKDIHQTLNPFQLKVNIERKLKVIFSYVTRNYKPRVKR